MLISLTYLLLIQLNLIVCKFALLFEPRLNCHELFDLTLSLSLFLSLSLSPPINPLTRMDDP